MVVLYCMVGEHGSPSFHQWISSWIWWCSKGVDELVEIYINTSHLSLISSYRHHQASLKDVFLCQAPRSAFLSDRPGRPSGCKPTGCFSRRRPLPHRRFLDGKCWYLKGCPSTWTWNYIYWLVFNRSNCSAVPPAIPVVFRSLVQIHPQTATTA